MISKKKNNTKFSVLIPDGESNVTMWVVMGLFDIKGIGIYILSAEDSGLVKRSGKIEHFYYKPRTTSEKWIQNINKIVEKHSIDIVMPIGCIGIETLIGYKNKNILGCEISLIPNIEPFNIANNKSLFANHLEQYDIPQPKTFMYGEGERHDSNLVDFPIILKPSEGEGGGEGIFIFDNAHELDDFYQSEKLDYPYIIQNYIKGYDIDCSVLCKEGKILAHTIQKGTLDGENPFVPKTGVQFLFEQSLYDVVAKLMESLHWTGVAHIDMRFDENDGQFKVIEVNPRFWGSVDASVAMGVNFPYLTCLASFGETFKMPNYLHKEYLNLLGLSKRIKNNILFILKLNYILNYTIVKFFKKDPKPLIGVVRDKFKSVMR